jgi:uncharacterized protein
VNAVGVELNTASSALLTYVSGLGPALAGKIVAWRDEHGPFPSREALKEVPRLGMKAFVQAAGFLRIRNGENPLDASAVHPESYDIVDRMAGDLNCSVVDLIRDEALRKKIEPSRYVTAEVGLPTLNDILAELARPGRDPREQFEAFRFAEGIEKIEDLQPGMKLPGIVTNLTAFGAFVDIGVHQDGLVHLSQISDRYVKDPGEVLKVRQTVEATVLAVDLERHRISLTLKKEPAADSRPRGRGAESGEDQRRRDPATAKSSPSETGPAKRISPAQKGTPGRPDGRPGTGQPRREKPGQGRPQQGRGRDEKVPFNNPFVAVFGKKP